MHEHPLISYMRAEDFEAAKLEFAQRKFEHLPPEQINALSCVLKTSSLVQKDPQFYKVVCNFIDLYQNAIEGKVNTNQLYLQCFSNKET